MKGQENYRLHSCLKELMKGRNLTVEELHQGARVSRDTISQLRNNSFKGVSNKAIARICGFFGIDVGALLVLLPEDIWLPIRLAREVTFHFGSRGLNGPRPARAGESFISRQFLGSWDFRAYKLILEYLMGLQLNIQVHLEEHITGAGRGGDPEIQASARRIFDAGNHVIVASPVANRFAEEVACHAYDVPPYNPQMRNAFPYGFQWDHWRQVQSSFGWQGHGKQFGIAALPSGKIVAEHIVVPSGEGSDAALILVYRIFRAPSQRETDDDDERIVICLLGYGGPGTLAAAMLATDPEHAAGLYPPARKAPRMRAVACKYFREDSATTNDNRKITDVQLIPEHKAPTPEREARAARQRRR